MKDYLYSLSGFPQGSHGAAAHGVITDEVSKSSLTKPEDEARSDYNEEAESGRETLKVNAEAG